MGEPHDLPEDQHAEAPAGIARPPEPARAGTPLEQLTAPQDLKSPRAARWTIAGLAVLATFLFAIVVMPFWAPLLLAAVLAAVLQKSLDRFTLVLKGRRSTAAALITLGVLLVIVLPLGSIAAFAAREAVSGFSYLRDTMGVESVSVRDLKYGNLPPALQGPIDKMLKAAHLTREQLHDAASKAADRAQEIAPELLKTSAGAVFHTVVMLLAFYFLLLDGRRLIRWLWNVSPLQPRQTEELLEEFRRSATGSIVGNLISAVFQGVTAGIGFAIFRVPHAVFFGLLTAITSFVPVVGTAIVAVPAIALLAVGGHKGAAIGLAIWYVVAVVGVEHVGKPFILRSTSGGEMHTGLVFLALLGGLEVFGLLGMVLGPLIVSFFVALMRMIELESEQTRRSLHS